MTPGGRTVFVSQGGDAAEFIDLLLVTKFRSATAVHLQDADVDLRDHNDYQRTTGRGG
jgi:hypothetical protein